MPTPQPRQRLTKLLGSMSTNRAHPHRNPRGLGPWAQAHEATTEATSER